MKSQHPPTVGGVVTLPVQRERAHMLSGLDLEFPLQPIRPMPAANWCTAPHNTLLLGPGSSTDAAVLRLEPHLPAPVKWKRRGFPLEALGADVGTLILQDVDGLSREEQARILGWIETAPRTRVISTTALPLFAAVARDGFDVSLYYRLNVLLVDLRLDA